MARVCPACRRMTGDEEMQCKTCGQPTVDPNTWREMRQSVISMQENLNAQSAAVSNREAEKTANDRRIYIGLGGMAAFLLFFVVFLIAYLYLAWR
jgi:hypothetical protein